MPIYFFVIEKKQKTKHIGMTFKEGKTQDSRKGSTFVFNHFFYEIYFNAYTLLEILGQKNNLHFEYTFK